MTDGESNVHMAMNNVSRIGSLRVMVSVIHAQAKAALCRWSIVPDVDSHALDLPKWFPLPGAAGEASVKTELDLGQGEGGPFSAESLRWG